MTRFLFLTGAPASGKLTVAQHIAHSTGYKVFHNHLTVDLAISLFNFGTDAYTSLCETLRKVCINAAVEESLPGLIFTFCYEGEVDSDFINAIEQTVLSNNGELVYVHLRCSRDELRKRVTNSGRSQFKKLTDVSNLEQVLNTWECESPIPGKRTYVFDTTHAQPDEVARQITAELSL